MTASDVDGDNLTYSATNGNATITVDGNTLTVDPEANFVGDSVITVNVSDGTVTSSTTFTLTFNPVNDAPVLGDLSAANTDEDTAFAMSLSSSDVDGDDVTYSASVNSGSATIDGSTLTVLPAQDFNGDLTVTVTVSDGSLTDSGSFVLTVNPINDAPVVNPIADQTVDEDTSLTLDISASDADGDTVTFSASVDSGSAVVDGSTLTVTPGQDFNGDLTVTVNANDGELTGSGSFILTVNPVNDAPVIASIADQAIDEDSSLVLELSASDVDSSELVFSAANGNAAITIDGTTVSYTHLTLPTTPYV